MKRSLLYRHCFESSKKRKLVRHATTVNDSDPSKIEQASAEQLPTLPEEGPEGEGDPSRERRSTFARLKKAAEEERSEQYRMLRRYTQIVDYEDFMRFLQRKQREDMHENVEKRRRMRKLIELYVEQNMGRGQVKSLQVPLKKKGERVNFAHEASLRTSFDQRNLQQSHFVPFGPELNRSQEQIPSDLRLI